MKRLIKLKQRPAAFGNTLKWCFLPLNGWLDDGETN
jgi:hypothetical protein